MTHFASVYSYLFSILLQDGINNSFFFNMYTVWARIPVQVKWPLSSTANKADSAIRGHQGVLCDVKCDFKDGKQTTRE